METNETMNEVINETTETVMETAADCIPSNTLKVAAGFGIGMIAGVILYKYAVVPIAAKIKERRNKRHEAIEEDENTVVIEEEPTDEDINDVIDD